MPIKDTITPAAPAPADLPQSSPCAESALMRRTDAIRAAHFNEVGRGLAAAWRGVSK